jgi:hypothetical protein
MVTTAFSCKPRLKKVYGKRNMGRWDKDGVIYEG